MSNELPRKEYHKYFTTDTRVGGKTFTKCIDEAPKELRDLIRYIHTEYFYDCLPDDWIYEVIHDAFYELSDNDIDDLNIESDPYHSQLHEWLGNSYAKEYCTEVLEEGLDAKDIYYIISAAQERAKDRIYRAVDEFIKE